MPLSDAQTAWKLNFAAAAARWNATLTDAQREAWRAYAAQYPKRGTLGQTYFPTGQNRHAGCNAISQFYALTWIDDPPLDRQCSQPAALIINSANSSPQSLSVTLSGSMLATECWALSATPCTNVGFNNPARLWRPLTSAFYALPWTTNAEGAYNAIFGPLRPSKKVWLKFQIANVAKGVISQGITAAALVS